MSNTVYIKGLLFLLLILLVQFLNCKKSTEPEIYSGNYIIIEIDNMTVEEFRSRYSAEPIIQEIELSNYRSGSTDYKVSIFIRDIGWIGTDRISIISSEKFFLNTRYFLDKVEYIEFGILKITKDYLEGNFEPGGPEICTYSKTPFKAIRK